MKVVVLALPLINSASDYLVNVPSTLSSKSNSTKSRVH